MEGEIRFMEKVKFIHCSDLHLDMPFNYFGLQIEKSIQRRRDLKDVLRGICELAQNNSVDFIMICGDLYDNRYVRKDTIVFVNELFFKIAPIKVFIIPGNHDPFMKNSYYNNFKWAENVVIFNQENYVYQFKDKKINVFGSGFGNFYEENTLTKMNNEIVQKDNNFINILGLHATVDLEISNELYNPMKSDDLNNLNMDYIALGHFHKRINEIGKKKNIYYSGAPEPLKFGDSDLCGVNIVKIHKSSETTKNLSVNFVKTNKRTYKNIDINIDEMNSDDIIVSSIADDMDRLSNSSLNHYIITLKGRREKDRVIDIKYLADQIQKKVFYVKIVDKTEIEYDFESLKNEKGLKGNFVKKVLERISLAQGDEKEILKKALYYGLEVIENGKLDIGSDI